MFKLVLWFSVETRCMWLTFCPSHIYTSILVTDRLVVFSRIVRRQHNFETPKARYAAQWFTLGSYAFFISWSSSNPGDDQHATLEDPRSSLSRVRGRWLHASTQLVEPRLTKKFQRKFPPRLAFRAPRTGQRTCRKSSINRTYTQRQVRVSRNVCTLPCMLVCYKLGNVCTLPLYTATRYTHHSILCRWEVATVCRGVPQGCSSTDADNPVRVDVGKVVGDEVLQFREDVGVIRW